MELENRGIPRPVFPVKFLPEAVDKRIAGFASNQKAGEIAVRQTLLGQRRDELAPSDPFQGGGPLVSGVSESPIDVALYAMASKQADLQRAANVKVLKLAMESEEAMMNELLASIGVGRYVDVQV
jgi:hypothetical protein